MRPLLSGDFTSALKILEEAFSLNPTFLWLIGKNRFSVKRLRCLCTYCLKMSLLKRTGYISSDGYGIAVVSDNECKAPFFKALALQLYLVHNCIGWHRIYKAIQRELLMKRILSKAKGFHFLILAVMRGPRGSGTAGELKEAVFEMSRRKGLPVYSETTIAKNKVVYERYGFRVYADCTLPGADFTVWFMKRESDPVRIRTI
jgi:hypothetical protein